LTESSCHIANSNGYYALACIKKISLETMQFVAVSGTIFSDLNVQCKIQIISIYTLIDLGVLSNLIGSLSLANEHYSPPTE